MGHTGRRAGSKVSGLLGVASTPLLLPSGEVTQCCILAGPAMKPSCKEWDSKNQRWPFQLVYIHSPCLQNVMHVSQTFVKQCTSICAPLFHLTSWGIVSHPILQVRNLDPEMNPATRAVIPLSPQFYGPSRDHPRQVPAPEDPECPSTLMCMECHYPERSQASALSYMIGAIGSAAGSAAWVQIQALPINSSVTLSKLLNLFQANYLIFSIPRRGI